MKDIKIKLIQIEEIIENAKKCKEELCSCEFGDKRFYDGFIHGLEKAKKMITKVEELGEKEKGGCEPLNLKKN